MKRNTEIFEWGKHRYNFWDRPMEFLWKQEMEFSEFSGMFGVNIGTFLIELELNWNFRN